MKAKRYRLVSLGRGQGDVLLRARLFFKILEVELWVDQVHISKIV